MNSTPVMTAIFRVGFILSLLVVRDFGVNKLLTPIYDLTTDTSA